MIQSFDERSCNLFVSKALRNLFSTYSISFLASFNTTFADYQTVKHCIIHLRDIAGKFAVSNTDNLEKFVPGLSPSNAECQCFLSRYTEIANNFQKEETVLNIDFVLLDNSPLKFALLSHCNEWQSKFTTLLREMGSQKLLELTNFLKNNAKK